MPIWESSMESRLVASSNGLRASRIAIAANRRLAGHQLSESERKVLLDVAGGLADEAARLRGNDATERAYSNNFTLAALTIESATVQGAPSGTDASASASVLEKVAGWLNVLGEGRDLPRSDVEKVRELFAGTGHAISAGLGQSGESAGRELDLLIGA